MEADKLTHIPRKTLKKIKLKFNSFFWPGLRLIISDNSFNSMSLTKYTNMTVRLIF